MKSFIEKFLDALKIFSPILLLLFVCSCYMTDPVRKTKPADEVAEKMKKSVVVTSEKKVALMDYAELLHPSPISNFLAMQNGSGPCSSGALKN